MRGWEYDYGGRIRLEPPPWDFPGRMLERCRAAASLLDMGTGGGEWLSRLPYRPPLTVATEGWAPNLEIARGRLEPLGIRVVEVEGAPDNHRQGREGDGGGRCRSPMAPSTWSATATSPICHRRSGGCWRPAAVSSPSRWPATSTASSMRCSANRRRCRRRRTGTWVSPGPSWRPRSCRRWQAAKVGRCCTSPMSAPWPGTC